ncbi:phosphatase 2C-like domain-containing protein [Rhizophagus diaphanus]|nr:phosphatase 2C-like domain-containing protein [Rhizophagus diaphanus] [Rhizophagus sp. MUCL 43196]
MGESLSKPIEDKNTIEGIFQQHDIIYVTSSMQGWRKTMEDTHTIECNIPEFPDYSFFGVYDGHQGKYTSEYLSKNLHLNIFKKIHEIGEENIEEAIKDAFMQTDDDWKDESSNYPKYNDGSTAIVTVITPNKIVYVGNAGDSRAVMSVGGLAIPLSEDHKPNLVNESQRIIQAGESPSNYNVSRAFGDFKWCKNNPDKGPKEQVFIAYPDVTSHKVDTDTDFLVLACDGIWDCMSSKDVINFINKDIKINKDLSKACENLMNRCLKLNSTDNMTVIIIGFLHGLDKEKWMERISSRCVEEN